MSKKQDTENPLEEFILNWPNSTPNSISRDLMLMVPKDYEGFKKEVQDVFNSVLMPWLSNWQRNDFLKEFPEWFVFLKDVQLKNCHGKIAQLQQEIERLKSKDNDKDKTKNSTSSLLSSSLSTLISASSGALSSNSSSSSSSSFDPDPAGFSLT